MSTLRHFEIAAALAVMLVAGNASADPPAKPRATGDSLDAYRERFQIGMNEYRIGAVANAIAYWEPLYLALGPRDGYRLAYDLGVAYLQVGDLTLAAERLESFLDEVTMRRESGDIVSAMVTKEEGDARARIAELVATKARIRVAASDASPGLSAQIDEGSLRPAGFVAWVAPGQHTIAFSTSPEGTFSNTRILSAAAGELIDVAPAPRSEAPSPAATEATPAPVLSLQGPVAAPSAQEGLAPTLRRAPAETRVRHPVAPPVILASGALTAVAVAVTIPLGVHTFSLHSRFVDEQASTGSISTADRQSFDETRTAYDVALGSAIAFGALTAALTTWYFAGSSRENAAFEPVVAHERGGASLAVRARF